MSLNCLVLPFQMTQEKHCFISNAECSENKGDPLLCLRDQETRVLKKSRFHKATTVAEAILYRADIPDGTTVVLHKTFICNRHFNQLYAQFNPKKNKRCYTCVSISGQNPASTKQLQYITREQALHIYEKFGIKHSYGQLMCITCRKGYSDHSYYVNVKKISEAVNHLSTDLQRRITTNIQEIKDNEDEEEEISSNEEVNIDDDEDEDFLPDDDKNSMKLLRDTLDHFLNLCGNKHRTWIAQNYRELTGQTRLNYLSRCRSIMKSVLGVMTSYDIDELEHDLFLHQDDKNLTKLDGNFISVMEGVSEAYKNAESWTTRPVKFCRLSHPVSVSR